MSILDSLKLVKKKPAKIKVFVDGKTPLQKAKEKFIKGIDNQISLAKDPKFTISKSVKSRKTGKTDTTTNAPRSWVDMYDGIAIITPKISNKDATLPGMRGNYIECDQDKVVATLEVIKAWAESDEADSSIEKAMKAAKRKTS